VTNIPPGYRVRPRLLRRICESSSTASTSTKLIAASGPGRDVDGLGEVGALDEVEAGEVQAR
jgi:hypothetical protein